MVDPTYREKCGYLRELGVVWETRGHISGRSCGRMSEARTEGGIHIHHTIWYVDLYYDCLFMVIKLNMKVATQCGQNIKQMLC